MILPTGPVTDAEIAAADLKAYAHNLARVGGEACCLAIEEAWGLAGFPPEIVSGVLAGVAGGWSVEGAIANAEAWAPDEDYRREDNW